MKIKVLIITGRYLPGYKDGGPVRSLKNLTDYLGDEYEFWILTCDRDHGDMEAYAGIQHGEWNRVGKANVYYVPPHRFSFKIIKTLAENMDVIYVSGCFNDYAIKTLLLKRINLLKRPVVIAAMGLFSPLAFRIKYIKKKLFVVALNLSGLCRNIYWSATSEMEVNEISRQIWTRSDQFFVAEDLPRFVEDRVIKKRKIQNEIRVVWISRIAPKKNLLGAVKVLNNVHSKVNFVIYGPVHDAEYWEKCQAELKKLPDNVQWEYRNELESEQVVKELEQYHVFLFPTFGENYGHVIQEAMSAGCVCVLSDQTPWRNLDQKGIGGVLPVDDTIGMAKKIDEYAAMGQNEWNQLVDATLEYAIENSNDKIGNSGYRRIFDILGKRP